MGESQGSGLWNMGPGFRRGDKGEDSGVPFTVSRVDAVGGNFVVIPVATASNPRSSVFICGFKSNRQKTENGNLR
jgi:hypothetical protein